MAERGVAPAALGLPALATFRQDHPKDLERLARLALRALKATAGDHFSDICSAPMRIGFARLLLGSDCELAELARCGTHWSARPEDLGKVFFWDVAVRDGRLPVSVGLLLGTRAGESYDGGGLNTARVAAAEWSRREAKAAARERGATSVETRRTAPSVAHPKPGTVSTQGPQPLAHAIAASQVGAFMNKLRRGGTDEIAKESGDPRFAAPLESTGSG
jgi:hypothetical protein